MQRWFVSIAAVLTWIGTVSAGASEQGKIVLDFWDAAYMQGGKAGYVHTIVREVERDRKTYYHALLELNLKVKRFRETIELRMQTGTVETDDGNVVGTFLRHFLGKGKNLEIIGKVDGKWLRLTRDEEFPLKPAPWDPETVGLFRQQNLFAERQVKPGDSFEFKSFEPSVNLVLKTFVKVKDYETVELFDGKAKRKLLRIETKSEKIQGVQLPPLISWVNEQYIPIRQQMEIPGLGEIRLYRTTKAVALAPGPVAKLPDIGITQYIRLKKRIADPYATQNVVYRIKVAHDENPTTTFSRDKRQQVKNAQGDTFELHVKASKTPSTAGKQKEPGQEYTESSYFINSDDAKVKELAARAVGSETDPLKKALRIERWVHRHMRPRAHEALATADHVAKTLTGDCSEFAMLTAAMCRAAGVPSRTALGLIYAKVQQGPVFAFHMWTEVFVNGHWIPLDATLGRGSVGATHLKISDQSWHETRTLTPLFPLIRVLGRVQVEIMRVN